jgi:hypothetical protein
MAPLSKCVEGISHYQAMGELGAPDRALQPSVDKLKRLVDLFGDRLIFIVSPFPFPLAC